MTEHITSLDDLIPNHPIDHNVERQLKRDYISGTPGYLLEHFTPDSDSYLAIQLLETRQQYVYIDWNSDSRKGNNMKHSVWYPFICMKNRFIPGYNPGNPYSRENQLLLDANGGSPYVQ